MVSYKGEVKIWMSLNKGKGWDSTVKRKGLFDWHGKLWGRSIKFYYIKSARLWTKRFGVRGLLFLGY